MIKKETVFILGAGASKPYLFPTGDELKNSICTTFRNVYRNLPLKDNENPELTIEIKRRREKDVAEFAELLEKAIGQSIDLFLTINDSFLEIGKIAILHHIFEPEKLSNFPINKGDWASYLFTKMIDESWKSKDPSKILENKVKFITFNYDRFLENFFKISLESSFPDLKDKHDFNDITNKLCDKIHHVYGMVGKLPWQRDCAQGEGLHFKQDSSRYIMKREHLKNIKLINERTQLNNSVVAEWISKAERIFFLGFSFADENLEALNIPDVFYDSKVYRIFGTIKGMHIMRVREVEKKIPSYIEKHHILFENKDCYQLLHDRLWND